MIFLTLIADASSLFCCTYCKSDSNLAIYEILLSPLILSNLSASGAYSVLGVSGVSYIVKSKSSSSSTCPTISKNSETSCADCLIAFLFFIGFNFSLTIVGLGNGGNGSDGGGNGGWNISLKLNPSDSLRKLKAPTPILPAIGEPVVIANPIPTIPLTIVLAFKLLPENKLLTVGANVPLYFSGISLINLSIFSFDNFVSFGGFFISYVVSRLRSISTSFFILKVSKTTSLISVALASPLTTSLIF